MCITRLEVLFLKAANTSQILGSKMRNFANMNKEADSLPTWHLPIVCISLHKQVSLPIKDSHMIGSSNL